MKSKEFIPFSLEEARHGREVAHAKYPKDCTRLSDDNLVTLCRLTGHALEQMHAGKKFPLAIIHALNGAGIMATPGEGAVKRELYRKAMIAMLQARSLIVRKKKAAAKAAAQTEEPASTAPPELPTHSEKPKQLVLI